METDRRLKNNIWLIPPLGKDNTVDASTVHSALLMIFEINLVNCLGYLIV